MFLWDVAVLELDIAILTTSRGTKPAILCLSLDPSPSKIMGTHHYSRQPTLYTKLISIGFLRMRTHKKNQIGYSSPCKRFIFFIVEATI